MRGLTCRTLNENVFPLWFYLLQCLMSYSTSYTRGGGGSSGGGRGKGRGRDEEVEGEEEVVGGGGEMRRWRGRRKWWGEGEEEVV